MSDFVVGIDSGNEKDFKSPVKKKLAILMFIFVISTASILLTDLIVLKLLFGFLGFVCFLFVAQQIVAIVSELEKIQRTLKDQNLKVIKKSIELSGVVQQFEDQNYDLELSKKEVDKSLLELKGKEIDQRIIFDNSPLGIVRYNDKGEIKEFNEKFVELMGSTREKLMGFSTAKNSTHVVRDALKKALSGEIITIENRYTSITGGKTVDLRAIFNPVHPGHSSTNVIATIEDITKRKNAERQLKKSYNELEEIVREKTSELVKEIEQRKSAHADLQKSEEKYRSILESIQDAYFELDIKGRLKFFNSSLPELLGYSEKEVGKLRYKDITEEAEHERIFETFNRVYRTGKTSQVTFFTCIAKGSIRKNVGIILSLLKKNGEPVGFQGLARDVTEQHVMEKRVQQTQKMEAIGNLAGGIAHDFNNILGGIIGFTQLIKTHTQKLPKVQHYVDQVMKASERATDLVKQILLFSRQTESEKTPSDLTMLAKEVIKLLRASIPSTIEIKKDFKEGLSPVLADPTQIHQVLMNLCSNASYAMKSDGGCLGLTLTDTIITNEYDNEFQELRAGEYIKLSVSDTGKGMDDQTLEQIFEPYYTTKEIGDGTGLGLATVHGIVEDHGGSIQVESEIGVGTTFHLFFPSVKKIVKEDKEMVEIPEGNERILFIDDELYLARVGKEMLEDYGYRVEAITSSTKAFELFKKDPARFDLIITDYTMPEMTGRQLIGKIRKLNPKIPVIMCTGISLESEGLESLELSKLLLKPLDMDDMLIVIRKVLDGQLS
jgi:PAS domain S-box-containing protein